MSESVTIAYNAVDAKLHEPSRAVKLEVQRILSYRVEGCEMSSSFKMGHWDGRSSFLTFGSGVFPAGFVYYVTGRLKQKGFDVRLVRRPLPECLGSDIPKVDSLPNDPRYDYQMEVVNRLCKHGQIIAQVATGGGKSRIARLAFARINRPTLFLTTRSILLHQMKDSFEKDLGISVSVLGDGKFGFTDESGQSFIKKMTVGMVQTLISRLQEPNPDDDVEVQNRQVQIRNQTISLLAKFEFVILDEAHEASGNSYFEILKHCKNANFRLALTATPFMKENEESNMRLMACSGPIAIKVTEKMLIERGILATPYFKIYQFRHRPAKLLRGTSWQAAYRLGIVNNEERNKAIVNEVARASAYGLTSMVLIQQKAHGDILMKMLTEKKIPCEFIQGADDQKSRKAALNALGSGKINALIGTTILDVGVDVPSVGLVVLGGGGKAEVSLRQRIGRGLRAKKIGPNVALVMDFDDTFNNYTKAHALQRLSIIKETEGFAENIVREDFDYASLGLAKSAAEP